jgi:hypothetical protein
MKNAKNCPRKKKMHPLKCEKVLKFCERKNRQKAPKKGEHYPNLLERRQNTVKSAQKTVSKK